SYEPKCHACLSDLLPSLARAGPGTRAKAASERPAITTGNGFFIEFLRSAGGSRRSAKSCGHHRARDRFTPGWIPGAAEGFVSRSRGKPTPGEARESTGFGGAPGADCMAAAAVRDRLPPVQGNAAPDRRGR